MISKSGLQERSPLLTHHHGTCGDPLVECLEAHGSPSLHPTSATNSIRTELQAMEFIFIIHSPLLSSALKSTAFCCRLHRWVLRWITQHNKSHSIWSSEGQNLPKEHANLTWESMNRICFSWNVCFTCNSISKGSN